MLRLTVLGSGSRGNALLVDDGDSTILIDAGFGCRALLQRMTSAGYSPSAVTAVVLTHEHADHASGAIAGAARWGWPIFASAGTIGALRSSATSRANQELPSLQVLASGGMTIGSMNVCGHAVAHDAAEPLALVVENPRSGARLGVAVDLGHAPAALAAAFSGLDILMVESNHDTEMLRTGPYPAMLKRRVASRHGHLSNAAAADFVSACAHRGLRHVVLAHLSETNNRPDLAVSSMRSALRRVGSRGEQVTAAEQRVPTASCGAAGGNRRGCATPVQLQLSL
jgi:phosphoribosyl 1,2-cyclic phosphodiesterase